MAKFNILSKHHVNGSIFFCYLGKKQDKLAVALFGGCNLVHGLQGGTMDFCGFSKTGSPLQEINRPLSLWPSICDQSVNSEMFIRSIQEQVLIESVLEKT